MDFKPLAIAGAQLIVLTPFKDKRGEFARTFCIDECAAAGIEFSIKQINHSKTYEVGAIRGMHFQYAPSAEQKIIRCIKGRVCDVLLDLRPSSATYKQHISIELSETSNTLVFIPKGVAHGFQVLEAGSQLLYLHSALYAPENEGGINPFDTDINITWPMPCSVMSDKDRELPTLHFIQERLFNEMSSLSA